MTTLPSLYDISNQKHGIPSQKHEQLNYMYHLSLKIFLKIKKNPTYLVPTLIFLGMLQETNDMLFGLGSIESKNISINRIDKISYQWQHYWTGPG